jgi:opacity protein-like surface antigen
MRTMLKAGLSAAALAATAAFTPASAADLYGPRGSIKDAPMGNYAPAHVRGPAGPCYVRGDLGYSWGRNPTIKWPVSNGAWTYNDAAAIAASGDPTTTVTRTTNPDGTQTVTVTPGAATVPTFDANRYWSQTSTYVGEDVSATTMENAMTGGLGLGCGLGVWGMRGEFMLGSTGRRKLQGEPLIYSGAGPQPVAGVAPAPVAPFEDPLHTSLKSYTAMVNVYKDLGTFGGVTPYIGAGVGVAYNMTGETFFVGNPFLTNRIEGASRASLAWSLMAGIGWQMTDRAILDLGYKYMDYGKAITGRVDNAGFVNPAVRINDITAHEFRVGLRYSFGSSCCDAAPVHGPLK